MRSKQMQLRAGIIRGIDVIRARSYSFGRSFTHAQTNAHVHYIHFIIKHSVTCSRRALLPRATVLPDPSSPIHLSHLISNYIQQVNHDPHQQERLHPRHDRRLAANSATNDVASA